MRKKAFIGIDLHTDNFTACYLTKDNEPEFEKYELNNKGLELFKKRLSKRDSVALESVSNAPYMHNQIKHLVKKVQVISSGDFAVISKSAKKNDKNDAHSLALFLSKGMVPTARVKSEKARRLASLIDTRLLLVRMRAALSNKVNAILVQHGIKVTKNKLLQKSGFKKHVFCHSWKGMPEIELEAIHNQIQSLNQNIATIEDAIISNAKEMKGYENLLSIKGIGEISAAVLVSVIDDINDFDSSTKLCSYFGIIPKQRESNDQKKSFRISKRGSKIGRLTLVQCTWIAIKYNEYLKGFYERIKKRRGSGRAIIATSRKLLIIIFNTLKEDWVFDDFTKYRYYIRGQENLLAHRFNWSSNEG